MNAPGGSAQETRQTSRREAASESRGMVASVWANRRLISQLTWRDIQRRYRNSALGILWSLVTPLLMLATYTFVFSSVMKARWSSDATEVSDYAIVMFAGMLTHGFFAECATRAPLLILEHASYVKKMLFPLDSLACVVAGSALFSFGIGLFVLIVAVAVRFGEIHLTLIYFPVVLAPLLLYSVAACWFLSALGVFLRDVGHAVGVVVTLMLFLSPTFYPISAVPTDVRPWLALNPLTDLMEQLRNIVIWGKSVDYMVLLPHWILASLLAVAGHAWFERARRAFADVV
jgi:lipopolysaccharide transport system permease protein